MMTEKSSVTQEQQDRHENNLHHTLDTMETAMYNMKGSGFSLISLYDTMLTK